MTTSATGGRLLPLASILDDEALIDFLQETVAGVSGLPGQLVRPRWQAEPPNLPDFGTDWAAIGITDREADTYPVIEHDPTGQGADRLIRHERLDLLCSFYGPHAGSLAALLRDGLFIAQNREALLLVGMALVEVSGSTRAPALVKERYTDRTDITVTLRREIRRTYPVLNLLSAQLALGYGNALSFSGAGPITLVGSGALSFATLPIIINVAP